MEQKSGDKMEDLRFKNEDKIFSYRVGAIIIEGNHVLMVKSDTADYFYSIGGAVNHGEAAADAVLREVREETGIDYKICRPVFLCENIYTENKQHFHAVELFFIMKSRGTKDGLVCKSHGMDGAKEHLHWLPIDSLDNVKLFPEFFKTRLYQLPPGIELIRKSSHAENDSVVYINNIFDENGHVEINSLSEYLMIFELAAQNKEIASEVVSYPNWDSNIRDYFDRIAAADYIFRGEVKHFPKRSAGAFRINKDNYNEIKDSQISLYRGDFEDAINDFYRAVAHKLNETDLVFYLKRVTTPNPNDYMPCMIYKPILSFERARTQRGFFIVQPFKKFNPHNKNDKRIRPIQEVHHSKVIKINNPEVVLRQLDYIDINRGTMYGDYDNIAKYITNKKRFAHPRFSPATGFDIALMTGQAQIPPDEESDIDSSEGLPELE
jgi:ADP-ribose pyrophosphatase YjhB (NUDIX family)